MELVKRDIIARLQREVLSLQGYKPASAGEEVDLGWGEVEHAFPNSTFPLSPVHEFLHDGPESAAATSGFISCLLSTLMRKRGACLWISSSRMLFPPALKFFGIEPDQIIFVDLRKEKDVLWALEEGLKCNALAAVIGEVKDIGFTASRRLQLAVESSGVTGFLIRQSTPSTKTIASVSRWRIQSLPSELDEGMPGVGFPRWNVELSKVRNGRPGIWQLEWRAGEFIHICQQQPALAEFPERKAV